MVNFILNVIYLPTKHQRALGTRSKVSVRFRSNWNLEMLVFVEGGKPENPEKNPRSGDENQQQTQPTYDVESGNRTRATLVGGERSHHCAIPAPRSPLSALLLYTILICQLIFSRKAREVLARITRLPLAINASLNLSVIVS